MTYVKPIGEAIDHVRQRVADLKLERAPECYAVSEALYYLAGGKRSGLTVHYIPGVWLDEVVAHWFLRGPWGEVIDLTAGQFDGRELPPYAKAKRGMFYPQRSNLAKRLIGPREPWIAAGFDNPHDYAMWQAIG
jgi:hypothetical protein